MKILSYARITVLSLALILSGALCEAHTSGTPSGPGQQKSASQKPAKQKKTRIKGPRTAKQAQKEADKKEKKQDKDYAKFVRENQKRSIEIQTPEVQARMKQNVKDANANSKARRKSNSSRTKRAGQKYR